jgi:alpha-glucoside transport system substrate-binding protein
VEARGTRALVTVALVVASCATGDDGARELEGTSVEVLGGWQGAERSAFELVLDEFERETGATATFTSTEGEDVADVLDARLRAGDPPDLAVFPQPGLLARYAGSGVLAPVSDVVSDAELAAVDPRWHRLATVDGELYGVWFKAANKSLVWYSIRAFEDLGLVPPSSLDGLLAVARSLAANGAIPFAVAAAPSDAWTLTDWFENLYLRLAGPDRYDALADRTLPWTDASVVDTLERLASFLAPEHVAGGLDAARRTEFPEAVGLVLSPEPAAAMMVEGDFVPGVVAGVTDAELGVDFDAVGFPGADGNRPAVVAGGDAVALLARTESAEALLRFLASPDAGEVWAPLGGYLSPNEDVDLAAYRDDTTRLIARALLEAGDGFRFDLSDLQPPAFGASTGEGMGAILREFLSDPSDPVVTAARLEQAAEDAWTARG